MATIKPGKKQPEQEDAELLPLLSAEAQYWYELSQLPELSPEQSREEGAKAKQGDRESYIKIVHSCFRFVSNRAWRIWRAEQGIFLPCEYLDLVQIGNLAVVEKFHYAVQTIPDVGITGYLCKTAEGKIRDYCKYYGSLIPVPKQRSGKHFRIQVGSLDKMLDDLLEDEEARVPVELNIQFDFLEGLEPEQQQNAELLYQQLYAGLETLSPREREVITRHYGLYQQPAETLTDIAGAPAHTGARSAVDVHHRRAQARLRKWLK